MQHAPVTKNWGGAQIGKFAEGTEGLSLIQAVCTAVFVSQNDGPIFLFLFQKNFAPRNTIRFGVLDRENDCARQTVQSSGR